MVNGRISYNASDSDDKEVCTINCTHKTNTPSKNHGKSLDDKEEDPLFSIVTGSH